MSPAFRTDRTGQVLVKVRIDGTGNVTLEIRIASRLRCHEVEAAIDNAQIRIFEPGCEFVYAGQQSLSFRSFHLSIPKMT
jgi:hypothetical protein